MKDNEIHVNLEAMLPVMQEQLRAGGSFCFGPKGVSMLPLIHQGKDTVMIAPISGKLKKYDIPLYRRANGQFVLHRVVAVRKDGYVMCGDNQYVREYGVKDEQLIGVLAEIRTPEKIIKVTDAEYKKYCKKRVRRQFVRGKLSVLKRRMKNYLNHVFRL
ncbi:MAG: S24/S26 family peptidase [Clostridia bacterium]|nr:S24/S26 family peptidase [Clostridia bacterium]